MSTFPYATISNGLVQYDLNKVDNLSVCEAILSDCQSREKSEKVKALAFAIMSFVIGYFSIGWVSAILASKALTVGIIAVIIAIYQYSKLNLIFDYILFPFTSIQKHIERADYYKVQKERAFQIKLNLI